MLGESKSRGRRGRSSSGNAISRPPKTTNRNLFEPKNIRGSIPERKQVNENRGVGGSGELHLDAPAFLVFRCLIMRWLFSFGQWPVYHQHSVCPKSLCLGPVLHFPLISQCSQCSWPNLSGDPNEPQQKVCGHRKSSLTSSH